MHARAGLPETGVRVYPGLAGCACEEGRGETRGMFNFVSMGWVFFVVRDSVGVVGFADSSVVMARFVCLVDSVAGGIVCVDADVIVIATLHAAAHIPRCFGLEGGSGAPRMVDASCLVVLDTRARLDKSDLEELGKTRVRRANVKAGR